MTRIRTMVAVGLAVAAAAAIGATPVSANGDQGATPFTASYLTPMPDGGSAIYECHGVRLVKDGLKQDIETCHVSGDTNGFVAGTYAGSPNANVPPIGEVPWFSDYDGAMATSYQTTFVALGNGNFINRFVAYYN